MSEGGKGDEGGVSREGGGRTGTMETGKEAGKEVGKRKVGR